MWNNLKFFLRSLTPPFWIMLYPYSYSWDKELNKLMVKHNFKSNGGYTASLGDKIIWIRNYPYACMRPYRQNPDFLEKALPLRPSRKTIAKAYRKYKDDLMLYSDEETQG